MFSKIRSRFRPEISEATQGLYRSRTTLLMSIIALLLIASAAQGQAQSGRLSVQQLGDSLTSFGKNTVTNNGHTYYTVACGHGDWKSSVTVSLSPNGNVVWMDIAPTKLPNRLSPAVLSDILKKNSEIGPMFFSINGGWLQLSYPVPNSNLNQAKIKADLEDLVNTVVDTHSLWASETLQDN